MKSTPIWLRVDLNNIQVVLVGDSGVGKTHLLNRFVKGTLPRNTTPTIGVEFATKTVNLQNGESMKLQIWDTAGQERYRSITRAHYRRATGALILYDVTKDKTYEHLDQWIQEIQEFADPDVVIMLIGNKVDLADKNPAARRIDQSEAKQFAIEKRMFFAEVSTVNNIDVEYCFQRLMKEMAQIRLNKMKIDATF